LAGVHSVCPSAGQIRSAKSNTEKKYKTARALHNRSDRWSILEKQKNRTGAGRRHASDREAKCARARSGVEGFALVGARSSSPAWRSRPGSSVPSGPAHLASSCSLGCAWRNRCSQERALDLRPSLWSGAGRSPSFYSFCQFRSLVLIAISTDTTQYQ
jgi:hypothetical protein